MALDKFNSDLLLKIHVCVSENKGKSREIKKSS